MTVSDEALAVLTALELREAALLSWGATAGQFTEQELAAVADSVRQGGGQALLAELMDSALVVRTPQGGFRTRAAETVRILTSLRQSFPSRPVTDGRSLVLDFRFLHRPRRRPDRNISRDRVLEDVQAISGEAAVRIASALLPLTVSGFQKRATQQILQALTGGGKGAVMVTAGTGSGKSLAFYLPVLSFIADLKAANPKPGVKALALYPRNELLKDQLRTLVGYSKRCHAEGLEPITVGTWFGPTPDSSQYLPGQPTKEWRNGTVNGSVGLVYPFLSCTVDNCEGQLVWSRADINSGRERLVCEVCGDVTDDRFLRLTRQSSVSKPPDLMLTTTESLNRQLASPKNHPAFGIGRGTLKAVLLDELHIYEGVTGAQNAYLFRRLSHAVGRAPVWVALSATLQNAEQFLAQCVGVPAESVELVSPEAGEMREAGAEYLLALRHDPTSGTGTLSTTIQTAMALTRCLDVLRPSAFEHSPSSEGVSGRRSFAFTDKLDVTNRLYWDLLNAEGWASPTRTLNRNVLSLAHLRSEDQNRLPVGLREPALDRDADGQWWWLPEYLGHAIGQDRQLEVGRTSSQDRGVSDDAEVVIATSTLEVGFDDARVGAVIQHKAPHDAASFLQRKGRAGRDPRTRPWTTVVLSDWGRDQAVWHAYDALFDPDLPPKSLPLDNRYVQRIQAVYVLLDWLGREVADYAEGASVWSDLTASAEALTANVERPGRAAAQQAKIRSRQQSVRRVLEALLVPGPTRERLRRHVKAALGLSREHSDKVLDSLFWDGPRPLLLAVVPTMVRRLRNNWELEALAPTDPAVRHRIPMRDFAPGNLFDDLLSTDVSFSGPGIDDGLDAPFLPMLRTLRDFMPGTVSRHFGVRASDKRHWIPVPTTSVLDIETVFGAMPTGVVRTPDGELRLFGPTRVALSSVPREVKDFSRVEAVWETAIEPVADGLDLDLPLSAKPVFSRIGCHLHARGDGARIVRFARQATGAVFSPAEVAVDLSFIDGSNDPVALGSEMIVDALSARVSVPTPPSPDARERTEWLVWKILHDESLPPGLNSFTRDTLAQVAQVIWALQILGNADTSNFSDDQWAEELKQAAFALGRLRPDGHLIAGDDVDDDGDPSAFENDDWLDSPDVRDAVRNALYEVGLPTRTPEWAGWWTKRYTVTAANVLLKAMSALATGLDPDALMIDLDPSHSDTAWITETGPGGIGAIEACVRAIRESPELLSYALASAASPSDLESLDGELVGIVKQDDPELARLRHEVISAWDDGHDAASAAMTNFFERLSTLGVRVHRAATTSISTRLLGPGTHRELIDVVAEWLDVRSRLHTDGLAASSRVLAAVLASRPFDDDVLRLPANSDSQRRARAIANVLWPWGSDVTVRTIFNGYSDDPPVVPELLRELADLIPTTIDVEVWDDDTRDSVHRILAECSEVRLRFDPLRLDQMRHTLLDLQVTPIQDQSLFVHPSLVAVIDSGDRPEAWFRLWETTP